MSRFRLLALATLAAGAGSLVMPAQALAQGTITRVSVDYQTGGDSDNIANRPAISPDGGFLCFESNATDLVPNDNHTHAYDIFWADIATGQIRRVSVDATTGGDDNGTNSWCSISDDGTYVTYNSTSTDLVAGMTTAGEQIFEWNSETGQNSLVSWAYGNKRGGNGTSVRSTVSGDGQFVAFNSNATNLVATTQPKGQVYVRDTVDDTTELITQSYMGGPANNTSLHAMISSDGTQVAYESNATNLVPNDTATGRQVFETDVSTGTTILVSTDLDTGGSDNGRNVRPAISATGQYVAFESNATDLVSTPVQGGSVTEVYLRDTVNDITTLVSVNYDGQPVPAASARPSVDADGTLVAFESTAHDVVAHTPVQRRQVYVRDLADGVNTIVSEADTGQEGASCPGETTAQRSPNAVPAPSDIATRPSIDSAGTTIAFVSDYCNLVAAPTTNPSHLDVYVWTGTPG